VARIQPITKNIDLTSARTEYDYVIDPGVRITSIYVAGMPAGPTILMAFGAKYPFQIYPGMGLDFGECNWIQDGISVVSPALAGQVLQLTFIPYNEGGSLAVGSAT